jgi:hypothetical protein
VVVYGATGAIGSAAVQLLKQQADDDGIDEGMALEPALGL